MAKLPKAYIKKWGISKLAWQKFRAKALSTVKRRTRRKTPKRTTKRRRKSNPKKGGNRKMGKNSTQKLFKTLRIGSLIAPAVFRALEPRSGADKLKHAAMDYSGFNFYTGAWEPHRMLNGWGPYAGTCAATYLIPKINGLIRSIL